PSSRSAGCSDWRWSPKAWKPVRNRPSCWHMAARTSKATSSPSPCPAISSTPCWPPPRPRKTRTPCPPPCRRRSIRVEPSAGQQLVDLEQGQQAHHGEDGRRDAV